MTTILAIDTAGGSCGVAVTVGGRVAACRLREMSRGQAEVLVPEIEAALEEAGVAAAGIDLIGVTVGPGAFTGLRLGLAAAGGYALATGCGIVGVTTLEAHAAALSAEAMAGADVILVAVDSRRDDPFVQAFAPFAPADGGIWSAVGEPACLPLAALAGWVPDGRVLVCGDAAEAAVQALAAAGRDAMAATIGRRVDPSVVARLAERHIDAARPDPPPPLYLRAPDAVPAPAARPIAP
jgi:tRNA threonylcarbamoyladenosine biosynthesis protein TsaB